MINLSKNAGTPKNKLEVGYIKARVHVTAMATMSKAQGKG